MTQDEEQRILIGVITGAHGIKGHVRLKSLTEMPEAIAAYKPLTDMSGKTEFALTIIGSTNAYFIAEVDGIKSREGAEGLRGVRLYVRRSALPKLKKREYYHSDLVGLAARSKKGAAFGKVAAVHDYGGGPFLEIEPLEGKAFMLPFSKNCVPEVDIGGGFIVIDPPPGWTEEAGD